MFSYSNRGLVTPNHNRRTRETAAPVLFGLAANAGAVAVWTLKAEVEVRRVTLEAATKAVMQQIVPVLLLLLLLSGFPTPPWSRCLLGTLGTTIQPLQAFGEREENEPKRTLDSLCLVDRHLLLGNIIDYCRNRR
mmetsp:Transcript_61630/g.123578  ORF Transcript_61630/g.123578 Transcript_61630/m.123578 type:complete len:135 (-) Transcript_61630:248-652(-)